MAKEAESAGGRSAIPLRLAGWSVPALLLLLPLVAMRFTNEVNWSAFDFIFAGVLFGGVGLAFEVIVRRSRSLAYRSGGALAVVAALLTAWVNAAVGMIGDDDPYNLLFLGVPALALIGAIVARFRPAGMTRAMVVAAVAQAAASVGGLTADPRGAAFSLVFAAPWLLAAALFQKAAGEQTPSGIGI